MTSESAGSPSRVGRYLGIVVRIALAALWLAVVASFGEVFDVWGKPDGYFLPAAGNMPHWGLYVLVVLFPLSALLLLLGWSRRWPRPVGRGLAVVLGAAGVLQVVWAWLLAWSFVVTQFEIRDQVMPVGEGQFFELVLAIAAGITAFIHVRDARALRVVHRSVV